MPGGILLIFQYCRYKVKLIPGNNRRGKGAYSKQLLAIIINLYCILSKLAAKAALHKFTQSREALQREKDLLKSVKVCISS